MGNTYVVAPNFTTAPPPPITRENSTTDPATPASPNPFAVEAGRVQLGDILSNPFGAELKAINRADRKVIDWKIVDRTSEHGGLKATRSQLFDGRLGVWAKMLATLGLGPNINIGIHWESKSDDIIEAKSLWTYSFDPTEDYVRGVLNSDSVKAFAKKHPTKDLYMISGIKVAEGAKATSTESSELNVDTGGEAAMGTALLRLLKFLWKRSKHVSFETSSDFVLAVQLRLVKLDAEGDPVYDISEKHTTMADGSGNTDFDLAQRYKGLEDDISGAKKTFLRDICEEEGDNGERILLPDM